MKCKKEERWKIAHSQMSRGNKMSRKREKG
jgi:hypothetical protein